MTSTTTTDTRTPSADAAEDAESVLFVLVHPDAIASAYSRGWVDGAFTAVIGAIVAAIVVFGMKGPW